MALFWLLAGVLSTLSVLILLLPWLRTIAHIGPLPAVSWPIAVAAALVLPVVIGLYEWLGQPDLTGPASAGFTIKTPSAAQAGGAMGKAGSMPIAIASLEARLSKGGGTADDWELLAKSFEFLGRPDDAARARSKQLPNSSASGAIVATAVGSADREAVARPPAPTAPSMKLLADAKAARRDRKPALAAVIYATLAAANQMDADGWADYADSMASVQGGKLAGQPEVFIAHALALDPRHPKALWLKASAAEEASRWSEAVSAWQILESVLDPSSPDAKIVAANLRQDVKRSSASGLSFGVSGVSGEVTLADSLYAQLPHNPTLFIVAKSPDAPGIPVAVLRTTAGAWPVKFTLNDSQAMMPGRTLSGSSRVTIEARISRSGQAMPATGDLQGMSEVIDPVAPQPLRIQIDRVIQ